MNIIIPLGGKGERFIKEGFFQPKPLIKILNKEMILYVLDNLNLSEDDKVFIIYFFDLDNYNFTNTIKEKYNQIIFIPINYQTTGAVETILFGLNKIITLSDNKKCVLLDCDTFYTQDILSIARNTDYNLVFYTKKMNEAPIYSYICLDANSKILQIKEKEKISSNANTGCYIFKDIDKLSYYCKFVLDNKITFNGEPYTSCVIEQMIKTCDFFGYELNETSVFSLGTPNELQNFIKSTNVFLFDLDGTIVITDHIYMNVWKQILSKYNISIDIDFFNKYIHGNSDDKVVNMLLPKCDLKEISDLKDKLFIENINDIKIIDGVVEFFKIIKSKGYSCSIVTNCNRNVATHIIEFCKITEYIDYITIGNECTRTKPYPDPYLSTIKKYNISNSKTIIFEDSKSGLLSARLSNVKCVVGITTNYNNIELVENGADLTIDNYNNINLDELIYYNNLSMKHISSYIKKSLNLKITNVIINEEKLKGGYISDIIALKIITEIDEINCVLKLENKNNTSLSIMAKKLGLYERENYFYDAISRYINVSCPKFYGLIKDDDFNVIGILMEDLNINKSNKLNLNLNTENINVSLLVIENLARLHSKFWNKDINKIFPELKKHNDPIFNPIWADFINNKWPSFVNNWKNVLSEKQISIAENIKNNFQKIQENLSNNNLTIIHGDVKSPNIFYNGDNNLQPIFLDWQYIAIGKGVQDMIFFLIESFDIDNIKLNFPIFKNYYYRKLTENGVLDYSFADYETDLKNAVSYFPFFVAIWFGTTPQDELIDKNFPFFFIQKLFFFLDNLYTL
jgi:beta-phosphoglucomutase-like phosphatase (HAD superfamily)/choline kinase